MTSLDYGNLLARIVAIEKESLAALSTPVTADAVPYFMHTQESFPYFTNRVSADDIQWDSEDYDSDVLQFTLRLVVGHITEGYSGVPESDLYTYIPQVKTYFNARENLQSAAYLARASGLIRARITAHLGFRVFQNAGISAQQVGTEFTLTCDLTETITQAYP